MIITGDSLKDWANFFVAAAGASSALAGLVMVAISVNIGKIVNYRQLPARAGAAIAMLILILITSMASLMHQPVSALGCEILAAAAWAWVLQVWTARQVILGHHETKRPLPETVRSVVISQLQIAPFLVGSVLLLFASESGLYWIGTGMMLTFIFAVMESWVLLVEIRR